MSRTVDFLLIEKGTRRWLYPKDELRSSGFLAEDDELKPEFTGYFSRDGMQYRWASISLVDPFLMSHDARVRELQLERDEMTGREKSNPQKFEPALLAVAVEEWNLPFSKDMAGYAQMPPNVADTLMAIVKLHCYGDAREDPFACALQSAKPDNSSTTEAT